MFNKNVCEDPPPPSYEEAMRGPTTPLQLPTAPPMTAFVQNPPTGSESQQTPHSVNIGWSPNVVLQLSDNQEVEQAPGLNVFLNSLICQSHLIIKFKKTWC